MEIEIGPTGPTAARPTAPGAHLRRQHQERQGQQRHFPKVFHHGPPSPSHVRRSLSPRGLASSRPPSIPHRRAPGQPKRAPTAKSPGRTEPREGKKDIPGANRARGTARPPGRGPTVGTVGKDAPFGSSAPGGGKARRTLNDPR